MSRRSPGTGESRRMRAVQLPIIPMVAELIRAHPGTISLGQGVAYYGPPPTAFDRVTEYLADPDNHKYGPVQGIAPLIELMAGKLREENGIRCDPLRRIIVTAGANMGFLNALFAITDPGDEVILPAPYYFNQEMAIRMLSGTPVLVGTDDNYRLDVDRMRTAISDRTRAMVTISPNNPSGAVYPEACLREINRICRDHGIYHISDEAYEYFTYGEAEHFSPGAIEGSEAHTISLYSLSKAYGFASWRIGYMVIPEHLYLPVLKAQDTNLICAPLVSQHAAIGALQVGSAYCRDRVKTIAEIRQLILHELGTLSEITTIPPAEGALYLLIKVHTEMAAMALVERLIAHHGVAVIPGTTFGMSNGCYLRVSYGALERGTAAEGIRRLVDGLNATIH